MQYIHYEEFLFKLHVQHRVSNTTERSSHGKRSKEKPDQHQPTLGVCILPTTVCKKSVLEILGSLWNIWSPVQPFTAVLNLCHSDDNRQ